MNKNKKMIGGAGSAITSRAKELRKANPKMEWRDAIKKASSQLKSEGYFDRMRK
jgi:hypothetical protein